MITANIIKRVFHISNNGYTGTCFTIEINNKQYIVTAKHIVQDIFHDTTLKIFHENSWKDIQIKLVGHAEGDIDISVFTTNFQISPTFKCIPSTKDISLGQDTFFLGFPYQMGGMEELNDNFPIPFIKKAILSSVNITSGLMYLDGINNPGFSGGPVIFQKKDDPNFRIASVISGFRFNKEPLYSNDNLELNSFYEYNTGIIISYDIRYAIKLIENNPIGVICQ